MPKSGAVIFGIALVAFSIGFNIWRYPIVWRMADPAAAVPETTSPAAGESSRPSEATSAVQPSKSTPAESEPATRSPLLATRGEPTPARDTVNGAATGHAPLGAKPAINAMPSSERGPSGSAGLEKPLVPVPRIAFLAKPIGTAEAAAVRRLPPVDPNMPPMAAPYASASPGGAIPIYPSTGIE